MNNGGLHDQPQTRLPGVWALPGLTPAPRVERPPLHPLRRRAPTRLALLDGPTRWPPLLRTRPACPRTHEGTPRIRYGHPPTLPAVQPRPHLDGCEGKHGTACSPARNARLQLLSRGPDHHQFAQHHIEKRPNPMPGLAGRAGWRAGLAGRAGGEGCQGAGNGVALATG